MRYLLTGSEMKIWEKKMMEKYQIPSILLMERAAQSVVRELLSGDYDLHRVLVICGTGNNGGDGLAIARMLKWKGISVDVYLMGNAEKMSGDAKTQLLMYEAVLGKMVTDPNCSEYTVIVDALLGIGCNREVTGERAALINKVNASAAKVIAVDVPSGISSDNGKVCGIAVKADATVTFFAEKLGMMLYPGREHCGKIIVEDLEVSFDETEECHILTFKAEDLKKIPLRPNDSHKGTFGKVLVIAGSPTISGAAYLAGAAAYRMGAGLVKLYTPKENKTAMQTLLPEALLEIYDREIPSKEQLMQAVDWADVVVIGPGLGMDPEAEKILEYVIRESEVPLVIDADGLNLLAKNPNWLYAKRKEIIITPHILEMARLSGESKENVKEHAMEIAENFVNKYPVTLILKDTRTLVAKEGELLYVNTSGNSGMATGGSGDVLAGIVGGLLAQGMLPVEAARLAVYLHGLSGDHAAQKKGVYAMTARDILEGMIEVTKV